MNEFVCPYCKSTAIRGDKVCRGCQAEIQYGAPSYAILSVYVLAVIAALVAGNLISDAISSSLHTLAGWMAGAAIFVAVFAGGNHLLEKKLRNRIAFKRPDLR